MRGPGRYRWLIAWLLLADFILVVEAKTDPCIRATRTDTRETTN